jgi:hypothetical protein
MRGRGVSDKTNEFKSPNPVIQNFVIGFLAHVHTYEQEEEEAIA